MGLRVKLRLDFRDFIRSVLKFGRASAYRPSVILAFRLGIEDWLPDNLARRLRILMGNRFLLARLGVDSSSFLRHRKL